MMWFVFLPIFLGVTTAQRNHFQQSFQQRHCRHVQQAYSDAYQQCKILGELDATVPQVGADDIGTIFFFQGANPPDAQIDYNRTTTLLMAEKLFKSHNEPTSCIPIENRCSTMPIEKPPKDDRYRTITGAHNNRKHPKWGKSFTPYGHILTPVYDDGISEIRKSVVGGKDLPGARIATNAINQDPFVATPEFPANHMSVMFGQLMAHDHGMRLMYQSAQGGATRTCCNKDYTKPLSPQPHACYAIEYPENDPYLKEAAPDCKYRCMNYIRSQPTFPNDCCFGPFGAVNQVSHYIDLSPVYGNTVEIANELRTFHDGLLKNNKNKVLPETCDDPTIDCYLTGDFRGTGIFFLGILQSMYHRFHNIVAVQLKALNPKWNDERIYQETRRVVIACYQNHVIDWLRVFSGNKETKRFRPVGNNYVGRYNPNIDASSTAEFSHAVFRVYHSNLADKVKVMNANNEVTRIVNLDDNDIGLKPLETEYDDIARGMLATGAGHASFTPTVRNKMFNNDNKFNLGLDLISTDLFIGRDLGVQPYYVYFQKCLGKKVRSWDDLKLTIPAKAIDDLKGVYKSVHDVDAYAGLALEAKNGSYIGEVGKCLIVSQYIRTTTGDRYFYNLPDGAYPFTKQQLEKIYKFSFSNFVCTVTNLAQVPASGFEFPISGKNDWVACQRGIDLSPWKGLR